MVMIDDQNQVRLIAEDVSVVDQRDSLRSVAMPPRVPTAYWLGNGKCKLQVDETCVLVRVTGTGY